MVVLVQFRINSLRSLNFAYYISNLISRRKSFNQHCQASKKEAVQSSVDIQQIFLRSPQIQWPPQ